MPATAEPLAPWESNFQATAESLRGPAPEPVVRLERSWYTAVSKPRVAATAR